MAARPNILWIITTQWRAQATGFAGDKNARTPWLDGFASEATWFNQAITPHPLGPQARAALLTGQLCPTNGVADYWDSLPDYDPVVAAAAGGGVVPGRTVAHALAERGYSTAFFGKWHLSRRDRAAPFVGEIHAKQIVPASGRGGFEFWEGFEGGFLLNDPWLHGTRLHEPTSFKGYQADILVDRAVRWLNENRTADAADARPRFTVVSLEAPHPPYHAPAPHAVEMAPQDVVLRDNVPIGGGIEKQAREELAGYYAHIEATDRAIGKLLAEIKLEKTVVVFTSVHGDMHGSHGLFRKAWPYEESVRVPLLVRWPGLKSSERTDSSPISLVDLSHMAVAWADGRTWQCRRDSAAISMPAPTEIALQCPDPWHGFRSLKHKLVLRAPEKGAPVQPWMYFDLERDPLEMNNLVGDSAFTGEIARLAALL